MTGGVTALLLGLLVVRGAVADEDLMRVNAALRTWVSLIESDRPFLVLDLEAGQLRLEHGGAQLRQCSLAEVRLDSLPGPLITLRQKLRRYRPEQPGAVPLAGPFDWEQHLATDGYGRCALFFDGGLLLYADADWAGAGPPQVRLAPADLRALYNAAAPGMALVVLPQAWDKADKDDR